jgi:TRAP-type C4-dicarboxylate transport system permease small subunit
MSQYIPHQPLTAAPPISTRMAKLLSLLIVLAVLALAAVLVWGGSDDSTPAKSPATQSVGGPNEATRGAAAATAVGAQQPTGGPNETLRGHAIQP